MLITATFLPIDSKNLDIALQYVVFPLPGGPITSCPKIKLIVIQLLLWFYLIHSSNDRF